jgi:glyoxylase-like metal-dependent hydrolase (beta-lactamase superfamily II)
MDTGIMGAGAAIKTAAEKRFGAVARPAAIILRHGHFDHGGALEGLVEAWGTPAYAPILEHPYLTGEASYMKATRTWVGD